MMRRKIVLFLMMITLVFGSMPVLGQETPKYGVKVQVLDATGKPIDLSKVDFSIRVGASTINGHNGSWTDGYAPQAITVTCSAANVLIETTIKEDINYLIYMDTYDYLINLTGVVGADSLSDKVIEKIYKLSELSKLTISTSFDGTTNGEFSGFLSSRSLDTLHGDDLNGSWFDIKNPNNKIAYVTSGNYDLTFVRKNDSDVCLYQKQNIMAKGNTTVAVDQKSSQMKHSRLTIPSLYSEYPYFQLVINMSSGTIFDAWGDIKDSQINLYYIKDQIQYSRVYLSEESGDIYNKSVGFAFNDNVELVNDIYCNMIFYSPHRDGKYGLDFYFVDLNGNILNFTGNGQPSDIYIQIFSNNQLVHDQYVNRYWDAFDKTLSPGKYTLKVCIPDSEYSMYISTFDMTVDPAGVMNFTFLSKGMQGSVFDFSNVSYTLEDALVLIQVPVNKNIKTLMDSDVSLKTSQTGEVIALPSEMTQGIDQSTLNLYIETKYFQDPSSQLIFEVQGEQVLSKTLYTVVYQDIESNWAKDTIVDLTFNGIVFGRTPQTFSPGELITRAEFAAYITNAISLESGNESVAFKDVDVDNPLYGYIMKASSNKIINGYTDGNFKPDHKIKRQDVAVIINNALKLKGIDLKESEYLLTFGDTTLITDYALDALKVCVKKGILTGKPGNKLDPQNFMTRAEAAVVISRVMQLLDQQ